MRLWPRSAASWRAARSLSPGDVVPEGYYKREPYPNRNEHWLDEAAAKGQLIICGCYTCKRVVRYLATDLLAILGPAHRASIDPPFPCRCGERSHIDVKCEVPNAGDWGSLPIRRPSGIKQTQLWRTVKLGDDVQNILQMLPDRSDFGDSLTRRPQKQRGANRD